MAITDEIPKSRITLTYRTEVRGEPEEVTLPFRLLIMGDLSKETSKDRQVDIDKRQIRRLNGKNLNEVMKDMNMTVRADVPNRIDPENTATLPVELPITSMKSFSPAEVARNVPKVRALLLLRKLLLEVQANIDNSKEFRRLLRTLAEKPEAAQKLLSEDLKDFSAFKLPPGRASGDGAAGES
ncbi:type VI secretion system contractile sheath small subunit [Sorangium sp. So ce854]|uniref:type VI secretion system contractile sheath small subunit n=1 Tax=Sorangium sp. So ce854 TaxID=3133322 RepID=UPI003F641222